MAEKLWTRKGRRRFDHTEKKGCVQGSGGALEQRAASGGVGAVWPGTARLRDSCSSLVLHLAASPFSYP